MIFNKMGENTVLDVRELYVDKILMYSIIKSLK